MVIIAGREVNFGNLLNVRSPTQTEINSNINLKAVQPVNLPTGLPTGVKSGSKRSFVVNGQVKLLNAEEAFQNDFINLNGSSNITGSRIFDTTNLISKINTANINKNFEAVEENFKTIFNSNVSGPNSNVGNQSPGNSPTSNPEANPPTNIGESVSLALDSITSKLGTTGLLIAAGVLGLVLLRK